MPFILNFARGLVVPMPTLPAVERKIVEVAKAVLVPLKYGICPAVPVTPVMADVPLPWRRPVKVEAPVPPLATVKALVRLRVLIQAVSETVR